MGRDNVFFQTGRGIVASNKPVVALPVAGQAPRPDDGEWVDAVAFTRGPVFQLRHETFDGVISPDTYSRAVKAMLAAGHAA